MKTALATLGSLLLPIAAHAAAPMERLVGDWISPDGSSRQRVESHFDGSWLSTRMWFRNGEEWVEVGRGAIWRGAEDGTWKAASRTTGMGGIELFESLLEPEGDAVALSHRAHMEDGTVLETREEWRFVSADRIDYAVYRPGEEEPWIEGRWVRREAGD